MVCLMVILKSPVIGFSVCVRCAKEIAVIDVIAKRTVMKRVTLSFMNKSPLMMSVRGLTKASYQKVRSYSRTGFTAIVWTETREILMMKDFQIGVNELDHLRFGNPSS